MAVVNTFDFEKSSRNVSSRTDVNPPNASEMGVVIINPCRMTSRTSGTALVDAHNAHLLLSDHSVPRKISYHLHIVPSTIVSNLSIKVSFLGRVYAHFWRIKWPLYPLSKWRIHWLILSQRERIQRVNEVYKFYSISLVSEVHLAWEPLTH